jgi:Flp pilus assembly pilin Flp
MKSTITRFLLEETGQDLIEYALLAALLAVACISGILQVSRLREFFAAAGRALAAAI